MAIFRCNRCAHLEERPDGKAGETIACPKCGSSTPMYNTALSVRFIKVSKKYFPLYVNEFEFRYNNRMNPDIFGAAIRAC